MKQKRCYGCMKKISEETICPHCGYDMSKKNETHQLPAGIILKEQYMIGKVLGQGGFGITYLGWDLYLDIPVAIKEYFPTGTVMRENSVSMEVLNCMGDEGSRFQNNKERFMREAKMLARFSDVAEVVQIKNFFLANNTAYIVMEYVQGITLKNYVRQHGGKLSFEDTMGIMYPMIDALCKVHKAGLVHRDISPDNIMMLPDGRAKLLDFGAVRDVGNADVEKPLTKSTEAILKQGYAPIEQYQNRGSLGPWTDVYALCATIYYCLTGKVPPDAPERFLGEDIQVFEELIPQISKVQADALNQGMALKAADRISSMDELKQRLFGEESEEKQVEEIPFVPNERIEDSVTKESVEKKSKTFSYVAIGILTAVALLLMIGIASKPIEHQNNQSSGESNTEKETSSAEGDVIVSGTCGESAEWELNRTNGTLRIFGSGAMDDYNGIWMEENPENGYREDRELPPWIEYRMEILSLEIGDEITVIGESAFANCDNLAEVQWGNSLQEIRFQSFLVTALTTVELPNSVTTVQDFAFNWCEKLHTVKLSENLEVIGIGAFNACQSLREVYFADGNPDIHTGDDATPFWHKEEKVYPEGLIIYGYAGSMAEWFAKEWDIPFSSLGVSEYAVMEGQCGDDIYWHLSIEDKTLYLEGSGMTWLYRISEQDTWAPEIWPIEWLKQQRPEWYLYRNYVEHIVVGDGITALNHNLFENMENLKTVDFGTVRETHCTFSNCGIEEVVFPETMELVGEWTISDCPNLKKVTILGGSEHVGMGLLEGCVSLEEVYFSKEARINENIINPNGGEYSKNVIFYVYEGSDAKIYAIENQIPYKVITD